jgi:hypothetical protein
MSIFVPSNNTDSLDRNVVPDMAGAHECQRWLQSKPQKPLSLLVAGKAQHLMLLGSFGG